MTRRGTVIAVAVATVVIAACSSSGDTAPTTPPSPSTMVATTTEPDPTTTVAPTTTGSPTTTLDPSETLAADVEADFQETIRLTDEAFLDPADDTKLAAALDGYIGTNREYIENRLNDFRSKNWATRPNPDVEAGVSVEVSAELIPPSSDVVQMQICEIDPWIVVEVGGGPNGGDAVVDSSVSAYRSVFFLRLVDGSWRSEGSKELGSWEGATTCPDE